MKLSHLFVHFCAGELSVRVCSLQCRREWRGSQGPGTRRATRWSRVDSGPPSLGCFFLLKGSSPNHLSQFSGNTSESKCLPLAPHQPLRSTESQEEPLEEGAQAVPEEARGPGLPQTSALSVTPLLPVATGSPGREHSDAPEV